MQCQTTENVDSNRRSNARSTAGSNSARGCVDSRRGDGKPDAARIDDEPGRLRRTGGKKEVPKGAPAGSGLVVVHLDAKKGTVCWSFAKVAKVDKPIAAHIHKGKAGVAGPVVVPFGASYKAKGCTKAACEADRRDRGASCELLRERPYREVPERRDPWCARRGHARIGTDGPTDERRAEMRPSGRPAPSIRARTWARAGSAAPASSASSAPAWRRSSTASRSRTSRAGSRIRSPTRPGSRSWCPRAAGGSTPSPTRCRASTPRSWRLRIDGLVEKPVELDHAQLLALPRAEQVSTFHCVTGWIVNDVHWGGVRFHDLLAAGEAAAAGNGAALRLGRAALRRLPRPRRRSRCPTSCSPTRWTGSR